jgi:hypothetical protein
MKHGKYMSNIEMVKKMQAGERPFLQVGYSSESEKYVIHKVGETWTDSKGKTWIQKDSGPETVTPIIDMIREECNDKCTTCGAEIRWGSKLDRKMYNKTRKCFDCLVKEETVLRIKGQYKLYEKKKMLENELSHLKHTKAILREGYTYTKEHKVLTYVNSNGHVEEWANEARDDVMRNMKKDFVQCLKEITRVEKELKQTSNEIESVLGSK